MSLFTFSQYAEMGGSKVTNSTEFSRLESDAEDLINPLTNFFYVHNDIKQDPDKERVHLFRKALMLQIDFSRSIGASSLVDMANQDIKSVSIDGTTVSTGTSISDLSTNGVYSLSIDYLYNAGLLYRGVPYC